MWGVGKAGAAAGQGLYCWLYCWFVTGCIAGLSRAVLLVCPCCCIAAVLLVYCWFFRGRQCVTGRGVGRCWGRSGARRARWCACTSPAPPQRPRAACPTPPPSPARRCPSSRLAVAAPVPPASSSAQPAGTACASSSSRSSPPGLAGPAAPERGRRRVAGSCGGEGPRLAKWTARAPAARPACAGPSGRARADAARVWRSRVRPRVMLGSSWAGRSRRRLSWAPRPRRRRRSDTLLESVAAHTLAQRHCCFTGPPAPALA